MKNRAFIGFEVVVGLLLFLPPLLWPAFWWPDNRIIIAVIISNFGCALASKSSIKWAQCMAVLIGIMAILFSWYRMGQSYESGLSKLTWLIPILLLGMSLADLGVILIRRGKQM